MDFRILRGKLMGGFATLLLSTSFVGCIQDEPANSEADILFCDLSDTKEFLISPSDTLMEITSIKSDIEIFVKPGCDLTKMAPEFRLTEGATISPKSGSEQDFSDNKVVKYVVTSENGEWKRTYNVTFTVFPELPKKLSFENFRLNEKNQYHVLYEVVNGVDILSWWSSGNPGFCLASAGAGPEAYPTVVVDDGYVGKGVKMTTRYAGSFGAQAGMPIAPGNLFLGSFNVQQALKAPLAATRFGVTFTEVPDSIVGWYKYKPGKQMTDGQYNPIDGTDDFNIYAVFYENTDEEGNAVIVDGTNTSISEHMVLYAQIDKTSVTDEWTRFSIPFEPRNGKTVDIERLKSYGYSFSVVFSSSVKGDFFTGAVGSELYVDEVEIKCKNIE